MASRFWVGGTGTWDAVTTTNWSGSSGGLGGQSVPVSGDTVTLDGASGGGTVTVNTDFNITSLTMGAFTGTLDFSANNNSPTMQTFNGSGAGTRTLNMGSGTWTVTGNSAVVFTFSTNTGLTLTSSATLNFTYSGSVGTRTLNINAPAGVNVGNVNITAGSDTIAYGTSRINSLNYTGFSGTVGGSSNNINLDGSLTLSATSNNTYAGTITFSSTTTATITSNANSWAGSITLNGVGGTFTLVDSLNIVGDLNRTITLTNGTFNAANFNVTCGIFSSSNTNTRTLTMGSGTWTLTGNATTIWTTSTNTNLILTSTAIVNTTYSGATGTRTIRTGTVGSALPTFNVTAGTDTIDIASCFFGDLNFTGFTGTLANSTFSISGNLTLYAGMTKSGGGGVITFTSTVAGRTITTAGVSINNSIVFDGVGGSWILQDSLVSTGLTSSGTMTLTNGTFNANNFDVGRFSFASSSSNLRAITMGSGTWTLTGTGTVWTTATTTGLTLTPGTSTIKVTDTSNTANTFSGGGSTFYNLWWARDASTASNTIVGSNTFNNFRDTGTVAHSILFTAGTTQTVNTFSVSGSASNLISINSTTTGTHTLQFKGGIDNAPIACDYLNIRHSIALPADSVWYAGTNSTNNQSVVTAGSGWIFISGTPTSRLSKVIAIKETERAPVLIQNCTSCGGSLGENPFGLHLCTACAHPKKDGLILHRPAVKYIDTSSAKISPPIKKAEISKSIYVKLKEK